MHQHTHVFSLYLVSIWILLFPSFTRQGGREGDREGERKKERWGEKIVMQLLQVIL